MRVITIKDGINDFGTPHGAVKKGEIYHILDVTYLDSTNSLLKPSNPYKGIWYKFIEREGYHWQGLFREIGWDDELEDELVDELPKHISQQY